MATKAHLEGNKRYLGTLDEFKIRAPKGTKDKIKAHIEITGESVNAFVLRAISEAIDRERSGIYIVKD